MAPAEGVAAGPPSVYANVMSEAGDIWRTAYRHPTNWDQDFPFLTLPEMFEATARRVPNAWAIDFMGRNYSYAELASGVERVACGLARPGLGTGDRVHIGGASGRERGRLDR